ncbi:MAG: sel1 repeat family protein [Acidiferrobacterales bacterium]|nr:sel1 repeat family protein [Acidiferrobacterales bacterium]
MKLTKKLLRPLILAIGLLFATVAGASTPDFDQAVNLHRSGKSAQALTALTALANKGDANAQAYLGAMYASGDGVRLDTAEALKWQLKAAEQGHVLAQYNAAVLLARGDKNSRNLKEAAKWFQKAGEAGLPEAQLHMGLMHEKGWGITRCPYEASKWYYRAGMSFLQQNNVKMAIRARDNIVRLLPNYYLASQLSDEIFLHGAAKEGLH